MPEAAFSGNWANITQNTPDSFQKVDLILKNPAPPHVPVQKVLEQLENFWTGALGLKCFKVSDGSEITKV